MCNKENMHYQKAHDKVSLTLRIASLIEKYHCVHDSSYPLWRIHHHMLVVYEINFDHSNLSTRDLILLGVIFGRLAILGLTREAMLFGAVLARSATCAGV